MISLAAEANFVNEARKKILLEQARQFFLEIEEDRLTLYIIALYLRFFGIQQKEVASLIKRTPRHLRSIEAAFRKKGSKGLVPKVKKGRPPKITPELVGKVVSIILELKEKGIKITREIIASELEKNYNLFLSTKSVGRIIKSYWLSSILSPGKAKEAKERTVILGCTFFAGGWLLLPLLLPQIPKFLSQRSKELFLTLIYAPLLKVERRFHLRDVNDLGFALLTGRVKVLDGSTVRYL